MTEIAPGTGNVVQRILAVMQEFEGIGKNQQMSGGGMSYKYRGIEDLTKNLHPILAKHGVVFVPCVKAAELSEFKTTKGTVMARVMLHMQYKIYGAEGDYIDAATWGEGSDSGDKASNKAMTAAFKYALLQTLCIGDPDDDPDNTPTQERESSSQVKSYQQYAGNSSYQATKSAAPASDSLPGMITQKQLGFMATLFKNLGYGDDRATKIQFARDLTGHQNIQSSKELTIAEAKIVIDALMALDKDMKAKALVGDLDDDF